jgi:hypothetical protein
MLVPGSNLLAIALGVIGKQTIVLYKEVSRVQQPKGDWLSTYAPGVPVEGSWQPVDSRKYAELGLDLKKKYFNFYTSELIVGADRGRGADQATYGGRKYATVGDTAWSLVDGWQAAIFVDIGPDI